MTTSAADLTVTREQAEDLRRYNEAFRDAMQNPQNSLWDAYQAALTAMQVRQSGRKLAQKVREIERS
jgi:hypothetical protein